MTLLLPRIATFEDDGLHLVEVAIMAHGLKHCGLTAEPQQVHCHEFLARDMVHCCESIRRLANDDNLVIWKLDIVMKHDVDPFSTVGLRQ